jgi:Mrp family chromosome partitioning ATPase
MSLEDAIEHTAVENLDVLTSGPDVPNPAEILNSESFSRLLEKVAAAYDRVLIDSPPVTAVTDPLILAAQTDVTILVLQAEVSTRRVSMQARAALASVDARVLGVAVNNVLHRKGRYGYYSGYGYYYYYYGHDGKEKRKKSSPASEDRPPTPAVVSSSEGGNGADREPVEGGPNVATRLAGLWRGRGQRAKRDNK